MEKNGVHKMQDWVVAHPQTWFWCMQGVNLGGQQRTGGGVSWGVCKQVVSAGRWNMILKGKFRRFPITTLSQ